jgi:hypothetical protein
MPTKHSGSRERLIKDRGKELAVHEILVYNFSDFSSKRDIICKAVSSPLFSYRGLLLKEQCQDIFVICFFSSKKYDNFYDLNYLRMNRNFLSFLGHNFYLKLNMYVRHKPGVVCFDLF